MDRDYESKEYKDMKSQKMAIEGGKIDMAWATMIDSLDIGEFISFEMWCKENALADKFDKALIILRNKNRKA